ncbi:MAG TPA: serine/threonine-protein kinase [Gemmatimonadales bacterium]
MSDLFERLRKALAPRYDLERELDAGGMSRVYVARHTGLQHQVAIKVLRQELVTAAGVERFQREARTLAQFRHRNIVPVHDAGEAADLPYYVMDLLQGETLEQRLAGGRRLPRAEVVRVGCQILDALAAAHQRDVIHRDIKPSNIVFDDGEAILTDFGVSKTLGDPGITLTEPGQLTGTIPYMPPEQLAGSLVTPRTDLYALGMVLFEAATGRPWAITDMPAVLDRADLPRALMLALRGALAWYPEKRWPDAESFKRALTARWASPVPPLVVGGFAALGIGVYMLRCVVLGWCDGPSQLVVLVTPAEAGVATADVSLADSIACATAQDLDALLDVRAGCRGAGSLLRGPIARREIAVSLQRESLVVVVSGGVEPVSVRGLRGQRPALVGELVQEIYMRILVGLEPPLPRAVLPKSRAGLRLFVEAERLVKEARWGLAYERYTGAAALDSTCWMCYWRRAEFGRWLGIPRDPKDVVRYESHADLFPDHYARQIRAEPLPLPARYDSLRALTRQARDFLFGHFLYGDELMHRGPLVGRPRREARAPFHDAIRVQPQFAPAWEHLAILWITEGDSAAAAGALDSVRRSGPPTDQASVGLRALNDIAFAWRFLDRREAVQIMKDGIARAGPAGAPVDAGPRYLIQYDVPEGALAFAQLIVSDPAAEQSALLATVYANLMLGRPDSAREAARRLGDRFPRLGVFAEQLDALLAIMGAGAAASGRPWPEIAQGLSRYVFVHGGSAESRRGAAWMLALRAVRDGDAAGERRYGAFLADEPAPRPLNRLVRAAGLAADGQFAAAIAESDTLTALLAPDVPDPFWRAALHWLRADWYERSGQVEDAWRELLWHENDDRVGFPRDDPQPVEIDAALGVEARWRSARLLDRIGGRVDDRCRAYAAVARLWAAGDESHRARADTARTRRIEIGCRAGA